MNGSVLCIISILFTVLSKFFAGRMFWAFLITTLVQIYSWGIMHNFTYTQQDYDNMPAWAILVNMISSIANMILYIVFIISLFF